jgi:hypothetical protein
MWAELCPEFEAMAPSPLSRLAISVASTESRGKSNDSQKPDDHLTWRSNSQPTANASWSILPADSKQQATSWVYNTLTPTMLTKRPWTSSRLGVKWVGTTKSRNGMGLPIRIKYGIIPLDQHKNQGYCIWPNGNHILVWHYLYKISPHEVARRNVRIDSTQNHEGEERLVDIDEEHESKRLKQPWRIRRGWTRREKQLQAISIPSRTAVGLSETSGF